MARIRTIKPEFWWSATVGELTEREMLTFIGVWNFADDYGFVEADFDYLAGMIWMRKQWTAEDVRKDISRCVEAGVVEAIDAVEVSSGRVKRVLRVVAWGEHQRVNRRSKPRFEPVEKPESGPILTEPSLSAHGTLTEPSLSQGVLIPSNEVELPTERVLTEDSLSTHGGLTAGTGNREQGTGNMSTTPAVAGSRNFGAIYSDHFLSLAGERPPTQSLKRIARDAAAMVSKEGRDPGQVEAAVRLAAEQGHANLAAALLSLLKRPSSPTDKFRALAAQYADEGGSRADSIDRGFAEIAERYGGAG